MSYPTALALTLLVEVPIVVLALGLLGWRLRRETTRGAWLERVGLAVAVNLVTHPVLWLTLRALYGRGADLGWLAVGEVAVWVVESLLVWVACRRPRSDLVWAALAVGCANAASLAIGLGVSLAGSAAGG